MERFCRQFFTTRAWLLAALTSLLCLAALTTPARAQRQNLLFTGDFETGNLGQWDGKEALDHELQVLTSNKRAGSYAMRVEVLESERNQGGSNWRAEVTQNNVGGDAGAHNVERWYGFSTYLPSDWVNDSTGSDIIFQFHERPDDCEDWRSPPLYLRVNGGNFDWKVRWDSKACSNGNTPEGTATAYSGPIARGRWVDWVIHVRWDYRPGGSGFVEVWRDGAQQPTYRGPNCYNDQRPLYLKTGDYKLAWASGLTRRVLWIDEVRIGNTSATYNDVAPGPAAPTVPAAPTNLVATAGNGQVALTWNGSVGATSYHVKQATQSGGPYTTIATGLTATTYGHSVANGATYYYVVTALNSAGESAPSNQASATPTGVTTVISEPFNTSPAPFTVLAGGTWGVSGGKYPLTGAASAGAGNGNLAIHNTTITGDFTLAADASAPVTSSSWDDFSIVFNLQDANNYYFASFNESNDNATNGIFKVSGGATTQLTDFASTITAGTTYAIQIERIGTTIRVSRNGTLLGTATDATFTGGKVGFGTRNNNATFDNLLVTQ